ncbi:MAG: hypothetical protein QOD77_1544 [Thermoplasmata archaeon]|jgi:hypothetical protein|nr:hypothetical protein [Thermoplasmata archaeon]
MARNRSDEPAAEAAFEIDNDAPAPAEVQPAQEPASLDPSPIELVTEPGPKKHIVFEGSEPSRPEPGAAAAEPEARAFAPSSLREPVRPRGDIEDIRSRIDSLGRPDPAFAGRPSRANLNPPGTRSRTLYTTEQGNEVRIYDGPNPTLTITQRRGQRIEERPFHEGLVDQAIGRTPAEPEPEAPLAEGTEAAAPSNGEAAPKRRFGLFGRKRAESAAPAETGPETAVPVEAPTPTPTPATQSFRAVSVESSLPASMPSSSEGWDPGEAAGHHVETFSRTTTTTTHTKSSASSGKKGTSSKRAADSTGRKRSK